MVIPVNWSKGGDLQAQGYGRGRDGGSDSVTTFCRHLADSWQDVVRPPEISTAGVGGRTGGLWAVTLLCAVLYPGRC